jgi:hypothetical protein
LLEMLVHSSQCILKVVGVELRLSLVVLVLGVWKWGKRPISI